MFEPTVLDDDEENDTYIRTADGLFSGTFLEEYKFDKTSLTWILVTPVPSGVSSLTSDYIDGVLTTTIDGVISDTAQIPSGSGGATTNSIVTNGNIISSTVNGTLDTTLAIRTNSLGISGNTMTSSINGVSDTSLIIGTVNANLSGNTQTINVNGITDTVLVIGLNDLSSATNTLTSNVNGISDNATIINSNSNSISGNTFTGSVNGVSDTSLIIGSHTVNLSGNELTSQVNGVSDTSLIIGTNILSYNSSNTTLTSTINGVTDTAFITMTGGTSTLAPIKIGWDGQGGVVSIGSTRYYILPYACTITGWSIVATGTSPTTTIDIWRVTSGTSLPAVGNTIMGTKPALSTGNAVRSSTLTSWSPTSLSAGDILGFNIDACSNALTIVFNLEIQ